MTKSWPRCVSARPTAYWISKIIINNIELSSWQGDGITYKVDKDSKELILLDRPDWFSEKFSKFDPWWLRADTATYDQELDKGIYTGHFSWNNQEDSC